MLNDVFILTIYSSTSNGVFGPNNLREQFIYLKNLKLFQGKYIFEKENWNWEFKKLFQIIKIVEFEIYKKKRKKFKFPKLWNCSLVRKKKFACPKSQVGLNSPSRTKGWVDLAQAEGQVGLKIETNWLGPKVEPSSPGKKVEPIRHQSKVETRWL